MAAALPRPQPSRRVSGTNLFEFLIRKPLARTKDQERGRPTRLQITNWRIFSISCFCGFIVVLVRGGSSSRCNPGFDSMPICLHKLVFAATFARPRTHISSYGGSCGVVTLVLVAEGLEMAKTLRRKRRFGPASTWLSRQFGRIGGVLAGSGRKLRCNTPEHLEKT